MSFSRTKSRYATYHIEVYVINLDKLYKNILTYDLGLTDVIP